MEANLVLGHPADARDYRIASEILEAVGVNRVCLMTNNPDKVEQLKGLGIEVVERTPIVVGVVDENKGYLSTKARKMGHEIDDSDLNG